MARNYSRFVVTGGAGFIGSHLVDKLLDKGFHVTVIDNLDTGRLQNIPYNQGKEGFRFIKGDIRNFDLVQRIMENADVVFHEAALVSPSLSIESPVLTHNINVTGTLNLLKASSDLDVKRFVYASSAAVYGELATPKMREEMTPKPNTPYGVSKLLGECYVRLFHDLYGVETVSLRYFNVYGPRQSFNMRNTYGSVISIFANRLLRKMSPVVFGDGEQTRDFVYIQDVVEANMLALNSKNAVGEVFNIGTGTKTSVNQVADILKDIMNRKNIRNLYVDPRPGDVRHGYADIDKANRILGYHPKFSIKEGLMELVKWYTSAC